MNEIERPILRYFGGKWQLAPWIISHFPPHRIYVEPFGGGAGVLLRKPRSWSELYNDRDGEIVNVFRMLQNRGEELRRLLYLTPWSRDEYDQAYEPTEDPLESARRVIVRSFMGFGSDSVTGNRKSGFRQQSHNSGRAPEKDWLNYHDALDALIERLRGIVIENRDARDIIPLQDSTETLYYLDPPYVLSTRTTQNGYKFEMSDAEHAALCEQLLGLKGMVIISGYESELYDSLGWHKVTQKGFAHGAVERTEVLWLNPACMNAQAQQSFL